MFLKMNIKIENTTQTKGIEEEIEKLINVSKKYDGIDCLEHKMIYIQDEKERTFYKRFVDCFSSS